MPLTLDPQNPLHQFNAGERRVIEFQLGHHRPGSFVHTLMCLIAKADQANLEKIRQGFPEEVEAHQAWVHAHLAERVRSAGYDV